MILPALEPVHARAALRVEVARAAPGRPFLAAVEIQTDPHWHIYWRNPGDSGVPTRIAWSAPKGWRVEPLEFPTPRRFVPGGIAAYGYEGKILFLARVTPTKTPGTLVAKASWLVCQEACVQGSATLSAGVPVGTAKPGSQTAALRAAAKALPTPAARWAVRATRVGKRVVLEARAPVGARYPAEAEFFPLESGVVDQAKPLVATLQGSRYVWKMDASPFPEGRDRLKGLLVFRTPSGRSALVVAPKIESGETP